MDRVVRTRWDAEWKEVITEQVRARPVQGARLSYAHHIYLTIPVAGTGARTLHSFLWGDQGEAVVGMGIWMMVEKAGKGGEVRGTGRYHLAMQTRGDPRGLPATLREVRQVGRSIVA